MAETTALVSTLQHMARGWDAPEFWVYPPDAIWTAARPIGTISNDMSTRAT